MRKDRRERASEVQRERRANVLRLASRNPGHTSIYRDKKSSVTLSLDCATLERDKGMKEDGILVGVSLLSVQR